MLVVVEFKQKEFLGYQNLLKLPELTEKAREIAEHSFLWLVRQVEEEIQCQIFKDMWRIWRCSRRDGRFMEGKATRDC